MYTVRSSTGRVVRHFKTKREAQTFVRRMVKSPHWDMRRADAMVANLVRAFHKGIPVDAAEFYIEVRPRTNEEQASFNAVIESRISGAAKFRPEHFVAPADGDRFRRYVQTVLLGKLPPTAWDLRPEAEKRRILREEEAGMRRYARGIRREGSPKSRFTPGQTATTLWLIRAVPNSIPSGSVVVVEEVLRGKRGGRTRIRFAYRGASYWVDEDGLEAAKQGSPATVAAIHAAARRAGVKIEHRATVRPHRSGARTLAQRAYGAVDRGLSRAAAWLARSPTKRDELHRMTMLLVRHGAKKPAARARSLQQSGMGLAELEFRLRAGERMSPKRSRGRR